MYELGFWRILTLLVVGTLCIIAIGLTIVPVLIELTGVLLSAAGSVAFLLIVLTAVRRMLK